MTDPTIKLLFVHNALQRFVKIDRDLLQEFCFVEERYERAKRVDPLAVWQAVRRNDIVFCWFASWHSLLPVVCARLQGKPAITVIGGYDTASVPEAGYGSQRGGVRKLLSRTIIRFSTHLITNSQSAFREAIDNAGADPKKVSVIYHGIEPIEMGQEEREPLILTVGGVFWAALLRKGLQPFVQAAHFLPEIQFVLVGKWHDDSIEHLRELASPNVRFMGFIGDDELTDLYQKASVYVQASLHEGFGMSLAEAMSAGCIPVGTRYGAIPEVIGDVGIYTESNKPEDVADAIQQALKITDNTARARVRARILQEFAIAPRREKLRAITEQALHNR